MTGTLRQLRWSDGPVRGPVLIAKQGDSACRGHGRGCSEFPASERRRVCVEAHI